MIAWEHCVGLGSECDVYKALKSGSSWTVSPVANTADEESNPDTNGTVVVYGANRASSQAGADIYWTSVAGGAETQLALDGLQGNPAISGNLVVFESQADGSSSADLFAYELSTNTLYQLTSTSNLTEDLSDVSVSPGGQVRVVW